MDKLEKVEIPEEGKVYKQSEPFISKVLHTVSLNERSGEDETRHIILDLKDSGMKYVEGQSVGVIPPGFRSNGKPNVQRLYSISSSRFGDTGFPDSVSLCVKRTIDKDPETGEVYHGICSNYLCDLNVGDEVKLSGPTGKLLLLPKKEDTNLLLIGTGTGIAPFKSFLDYFKNRGKPWGGIVSVIFGYKYSQDALYCTNVMNDMNEYNFRNFHFSHAVSREQTTELGEKMYVQNRFKEVIDHHFDKLVNFQTALYICGLKGMEKGIESIMSEEAEKRSINWPEIKKSLRRSGYWNVEVY